MAKVKTAQTFENIFFHEKSPYYEICSQNLGYPMVMEDSNYRGEESFKA